MRRAADKTWERPAIAVDPAAHAAEIEPVAPLGEFGRALGIDCDVRHQRAPDRFLASAKHRAADPAARAVSANEDLRIEDAVLCADVHAARVLNNVEHATAFYNFDSRLARSPRQHRVEQIAPNHGG